MGSIDVLHSVCIQRVSKVSISKNPSKEFPVIGFLQISHINSSAMCQTLQIRLDLSFKVRHEALLIAKLEDSRGEYNHIGLLEDISRLYWFSTVVANHLTPLSFLVFLDMKILIHIDSLI